MGGGRETETDRDRESFNKIFSSGMTELPLIIPPKDHLKNINNRHEKPSVGLLTEAVQEIPQTYCLWLPPRGRR